MRLQHALQRGALGGPLRCPGNLVIRLGRNGVDINIVHVSFTITRFYPGEQCMYMLKLWASMPEYLLAAAANLVCSTKGRFHDAMHPCPTRSQKKPGRRAIGAPRVFCGMLPVAGHFHAQPTPQSEGYQAHPPTQGRFLLRIKLPLHGTARSTGWTCNPLPSKPC